MDERPLKQMRFKDWEVENLINNDNDAGVTDANELTLQGTVEFEERKQQEQDRFCSKLANGNELAMIHLGTINEDE